MRPFCILFLTTFLFAADFLDIHVLRVEFDYEEPDNSLTTGRGIFEKDRGSEAYWKSQLEFAKNYFEQASNSNVSIAANVYPKVYKLKKKIIDYNRTSRRNGEKMEAFDSAKTVDYANFVNDVLEAAKKDIESSSVGGGTRRVILIAHAGHSRLVDGGTMGTKGANTPGDFMDAYIDTSWGEFWRGFKISETDFITSVMVTSETAEQDGLNWGINGTIISQIGRELGLPYSFDVVKGYSRLGYFDGMDFAGYNAGNGFFPSLPSAWMRAYKGWQNVTPISPSKDKKVEIEICAAGYSDCGSTPQIVKIPINNNEYILLENRQRTEDPFGMVRVRINGKEVPLHVDSLQSAKFLDSARIIEHIDMPDAAIPASGIAAWHVNDWYIRELLNFGAVNAWNGDTFRDHQFGISLLEADGILGLGKEFRSASGEPAFYFGSGSDLIPHHKKGKKDTIFSINPSGYANTASTFGGYSGIKITAKIPADAKPEKSYNGLTGDSVTTWRALKIPVEIEWIGKYARPVTKEQWPYIPDFTESKWSDFSRISLGTDSMFLGNNRLHIIDSNGVPLPNFPVVLSNGEPFNNFHSKPLAIDIKGDDSLAILVPTNNGLILAVNGKGKLLKDEFPLAAGTFEYDKTDTLLLHISSDHKYLFAKHRGDTSAFYLPLAKPYLPNAKAQTQKDEISEFFIFPNPVRGGKAAMRFRILAPAASASLEIYDITGYKVVNRNISNVNHGSNQIDLDLSKLGSDVYSAKLTVKFASGQKKEKWVRIGVIR